MALVFGIDPGFAAIGFTLVEMENLTVTHLGVIKTEKSDKKRKVLAADDNLRRSREIAKRLSPLVQGVSAICAEAMSFPRNASAAAKVALCWGVLSCLSEIHDIPIVQVSPKELKIAVCGNGSASKEDVAAVLDKRFGRAFGEELLVGKGVPRGLHEHAYDALGAVVACLDSEVLRMARKAS